MINLLKKAANDPLERILRIQAVGTFDVGTKVLYYNQKYVVSVKGTTVVALVNVKTAEVRNVDNVMQISEGTNSVGFSEGFGLLLMCC